MEFLDRANESPEQARWVASCELTNKKSNSPEIGDMVILKETKTKKLFAYKIHDTDGYTLTGQQCAIKAGNIKVHRDLVQFNESKVCALIK